MQPEKSVGTRLTQIIITFLILISCTLLASADQTNDSDKYTFTNYGGEVYTPEPMKFGANLNGNESVTLENGTERKHIILQFYDNTTYEQLLLLDKYGVKILDVAADDTYFVSMPTNYTAADLPGDVGLRWMGDIPIEDKYDPSYGLNVPEIARTEDGQVELWLVFFEDVTYEEAQTIANKYSSSVPRFEMYPDSFNSVIITNESNLTKIVSEDAIERIVFAEGEPDVESESEEEKESPGFTVTITILIFALITIFSKKKV